MKLFLTSFLVMSFVLFSAQNTIRILDAETQKPIPYAKIIFENSTYRNAEENGEIVLNDDEKITQIDAFGYEVLRPERFQNTYLLNSKITEIEEVFLYKPTFQHRYKVGKIGNKRTYFLANLRPEILASNITFKNDSNQPLFVKSIAFMTRVVDKPFAKVKLNVYSTEEGLPGELIYSEIVKCKKGHEKHKIILKKNLRFPDEGLIVGFEWILNSEHIYKMSSRFPDGLINESQHYNPEIVGVNESNLITIHGNLIDGEWKFVSTKLKKYHPGIQLVLTD